MLSAWCTDDATHDKAADTHDGDVDDDDVRSSSSQASFVSVASTAALQFEQRIAQLSCDVCASQQQQQQQPLLSPSHSRTSSLSSSSSLTVAQQPQQRRDDDDDDDDDVYLSVLLHDITQHGACAQTRFCAYPSADELRRSVQTTTTADDADNDDNNNNGNNDSNNDGNNNNDHDDDASAAIKLFVGGLRFELVQLGRRAVAWLLAEACGVRLPMRCILIHRKARRGGGGGTSVSPTGCASLFVRHRDDADALLCMNQRVYCAAEGLYIAASAADLRETMALHGFACHTCQERGPTHPVIIERAHHHVHDDNDTTRHASPAAQQRRQQRQQQRQQRQTQPQHHCHDGSSDAGSSSSSCGDHASSSSCARHVRRRGGVRHHSRVAAALLPPSTSSSSAVAPTHAQQQPQQCSARVTAMHDRDDTSRSSSYSNASSYSSSSVSSSSVGSSSVSSGHRHAADGVYAHDEATALQCGRGIVDHCVRVYTTPHPAEMTAMVVQPQQGARDVASPSSSSPLLSSSPLQQPLCTLFVGGLPPCASPLWVAWLFALLGVVVRPQHVTLLPAPPPPVVVVAAAVAAGAVTAHNDGNNTMAAVVQVRGTDVDVALRHHGRVACSRTRVCVAASADVLAQWLCCNSSSSNIATVADAAMTVLYVERRLCAPPPPPSHHAMTTTTRLPLSAVMPPPPPWPSYAASTQQQQQQHVMPPPPPCSSSSSSWRLHMRY